MRLLGFSAESAQSVHHSSSSGGDVWLQVGDLRVRHTEKDRSTEDYSVVSMVKNTQCVLVRISIETNTHLVVRQGSPIFLICLFFSL